MASTALVLGAGGITGVAWQLGVLIGLHDRGLDLAGADLIVGTSAGAMTGALIGAFHDPRTAAAVEAPLGPGDPPLHADWNRGAVAFGLLQDDSLKPAEMRRRIGAIALEAEVGPPDPWLAAFARRLPITSWPARLLVTAVDVHSGEPVRWTAGSGVPLAAAVAASCAVPCIFPPIPVNGSRYMDGGVRSRTNADLAAGHDTVYVLAPRMPMLQREAVDPSFTLIEPSAAAMEAIGGNVFDATRWTATLQAGESQARTMRL
ncbi:patatin-like phospholipase family protein [Dactylosporangium sp. AC04546]|uniref:patatin-like phospholipase family protein n=1 Tax=Dactylosporangium sp. AC04546 TaxID=2862460 RepID=UPI001EE0A34A|nr:patatin-like phospholipase family protein [Dactylosporangium sp. AC04546]WVK83088.1 patatin-like phospholipase family protein [Dactylosporangium sp. AC04546]